MAASKEGTNLAVLIQDFAERYELDEEALREAVEEQLITLAANKIATTAFQKSRVTWGGRRGEH